MNSNNNKSVWAERFEALLRDPALAARLSHRPEPIKGLRTRPIPTAVQLLDQQLGHIRVSSDQDVAIAQNLLGICQAHALSYYETVEAFNKRVHAKELDLPTNPTTRMLTAEAGLGKSKLMEALLRVLGAPVEIHVSPKLPPQRFVGMVLVRIESNTRRGDLLNALALAAGLAADYRSGTKAEVDRLRLQLYRAGVMLIVVDELQFLAQSATAHAAVAKTLHFLRQLGVPVVFVGNYSLAHKLILRNTEDTQRFLMHQLVMLPDAPDDKSFVEMLSECVRVMDGALNVDPTLDAPMIHWYTGGNRRAWRALLVRAYEEVRLGAQQGDRDVQITMNDLKGAYGSTGYDTFRREVEICRKQLVDGECVRSDLWCPFVLEQRLVAKRAVLADQMQRAHIGYKALGDAMTPDEKAGLKSVVSTLTPLAPGIGDQAKRRRAAAPQFTLEEMMASRPTPRKKRRAA